VDEGILGPGGRKFIAALVALAIVGAIAIAALSIDFGDMANALDEESPPEKAEHEPRPQKTGPAPPALSTGGLAHAMSALREEVNTAPVMLRGWQSPTESSSTYKAITSRSATGGATSN